MDNFKKLELLRRVQNEMWFARNLSRVIWFVFVVIPWFIYLVWGSSEPTFVSALVWIATSLGGTFSVGWVADQVACERSVRKIRKQFPDFKI